MVLWLIEGLNSSVTMGEAAAMGPAPLTAVCLQGIIWPSLRQTQGWPLGLT